MMDMTTMTEMEECELVSDFANTIIRKHRNPALVIKSLANLQCTIATLMSDHERPYARPLSEIPPMYWKDIL
jgi:hypothetical protein